MMFLDELFPLGLAFCGLLGKFSTLFLEFGALGFALGLQFGLLFFGQFCFRSGAGLVGNAMFTAYHVAGAGAGSLFGIGGHSGGRGGCDDSGGQKGENEILSFHRDILVVKGEVFGNTAPVYRKESELSHVSNCFTT